MNDSTFPPSNTAEQRSLDGTTSTAIDTIENVEITNNCYDIMSNAVHDAPPNDPQPPVPRASDDSNMTEEKEGEEATRACRRSRIKKMCIGLALLSFIIFVIIDFTTARNLQDGINSFLSWIEDNPIPGFFAFVLVYFVATVLFVPGSILTLGAGFVFANAFGLAWGVLLGSLSVFLGASSGAVVAFLLGRYLLRAWVVAYLTRKYALFQALDAALEEKGLRIMILLRLSPIIPFNAINYIGGVTAISLARYCLALVAILPGTALYVFLGASAGSLTESASSGENATVTVVVVVVGAVFGILAIAATSYYAKKELNRVVEARQQQERQQQRRLQEEGRANSEQGQGEGEGEGVDVEAPKRQREGTTEVVEA